MYTVSLTHQLVAIQDDFDLDKIIESGQCFRPQKLPTGVTVFFPAAHFFI